MFKNFCVAQCSAGFGSLERGNKQQHLHVQAMCRIKMAGAVNVKMINMVRNMIKAALGIRRGDQSGCAVYVRGLCESFCSRARLARYVGLLHEGHGQTALSGCSIQMSVKLILRLAKLHGLAHVCRMTMIVSCSPRNLSSKRFIHRCDRATVSNSYHMPMCCKF